MSDDGFRQTLSLKATANRAIFVSTSSCRPITSMPDYHLLRPFLEQMAVVLVLENF